MMSPDITTTVGELGEHGIIDLVRRRLREPPPWVIVGLGDDAAVVRPVRNAHEVITTDASIEGVHFDRRFMAPAMIGRRALIVNLSDLAAMGAAPRLATLSLALPGVMAVSDLEGLLDGLVAVADETDTVLVGGNVTRSPGPMVIDVTLVGQVRPRRLLTRGGARPGDHVFVSGTLGDARAGLAICRAGGDIDQSAHARLMACYLLPEARIGLGAALGNNRAATAVIDLSDGLADGVAQIATASRVGILLDAETLPVSTDARAWCAARGLDPIGEALEGGDDYELLFTVSPRRAGRLRHVRRLHGDLPITRIGTVTRDGGLRMTRDGRTTAIDGGFEHFRSS